MNDDVKKFDPALADGLVAVLAAGRTTMNLSKADFDWGTSLAWTYGQVAPVDNAAQAEAYANEIGKILARAGAPMPKAAIADFVRTPEGMRAIALDARINEWRGKDDSLN